MYSLLLYVRSAIYPRQGTVQMSNTPVPLTIQEESPKPANADILKFCFDPTILKATLSRHRENSWDGMPLETHETPTPSPLAACRIPNTRSVNPQPALYASQVPWRCQTGLAWSVFCGSGIDTSPNSDDGETRAVLAVWLDPFFPSRVLPERSSNASWVG